LGATHRPRTVCTLRSHGERPVLFPPPCEGGVRGGGPGRINRQTPDEGGQVRKPAENGCLKAGPPPKGKSPVFHPRERPTQITRRNTQLKSTGGVACGPFLLCPLSPHRFGPAPLRPPPGLDPDSRSARADDAERDSIGDRSDRRGNCRCGPGAPTVRASAPIGRHRPSVSVGMPLRDISSPSAVDNTPTHKPCRLPTRLGSSTTEAVGKLAQVSSGTPHTDAWIAGKR